MRSIFSVFDCTYISTNLLLALPQPTCTYLILITATFSSITNKYDFELRVEMEDEGGFVATALYDLFRLGEGPEYELTVGKYVYQGGSAEAGDSLSVHNGSTLFMSSDDTSEFREKACMDDIEAPAW